MFQQYLPGFEGIFPFETASESILDAERTINHFESRGYDLLIDWTPEDESECYVPERILTPSGKILDENSLLAALDNEKRPNKRKEVVEAYFYYLAVRHPERHVDEVVRGRHSFIDSANMVTSFHEYHPTRQQFL